MSEVLSYECVGVRAFTTTRSFFHGEATHPERERCVELLTDYLGHPAVIAHQQHTDHIARIDKPLTPTELEAIDALITDKPNICLCVTTADCIPILLYDSIHHAIAAIHAGWRGTAKRIAEKTIRRMHQEYGTRPQEIETVICPGIQRASYEVGDEVLTAFQAAGFHLSEITTGRHLDLPLTNKLSLLAAGVEESHIRLSPLDTFQHTDILYSYRHDGPHTGRNLNCITLS